MANPSGPTSDVTAATDNLMKTLLEKAQDPTEDLDLDRQLQIMQAATRWIAVKNRMNMPEEGNSFDDWRSAIAGAAAGTAGGGEPAPTSAAGAEAPSAKRAARRRKAASGSAAGSPPPANGSAIIAAAHRSS